ncbi:lysylphosphatidylglycerol synthase transmembrane domain-containing protein [Bifidobacterium choloepi]|uniref:Flippase-like domain-containing protein n=1 Tax=Bifidobacterium choloepi TaxID=2614131 RepID=A0A6I5ND56_9BIFI|nr:lysylphosphatidylglycerol synthase transmembrane domain-containing protein [Bifidobacterium choloepi]NEG69384.1 flippase-like domain-containing protein [Bifidobacterium choloepi]
MIRDVEPQRTRVSGDLMHAVISLVGIVVVMLFALYLRGIASGVEYDARNAVNAVEWVVDLPASMLQQLCILVIVVSVLLQLIVNKEWLQSTVAAITLILGFAAAWGVSSLITLVGNTTLITAFISAGTNVGPSLLPDFYAALAAFLTFAGPRRMRSAVKWGWNILIVVACVLIITSWSTVIGAVVSVLVGRMVGLVVRFVVGTQNTGAWGMQIVGGLKTIGIQPKTLTRREDAAMDPELPATLVDDLVEHSRIYDAIDVDGSRYIVSVLDNQVHYAGYLGQVWQWIRLSGVAVRHDRSASDATHHHLAMLLGLRALGLETIPVYGVTDVGESSIMVFRDEPHASACDPDTLTDDDIVSVMDYMQAAHDRGYTHRQITASTLARMDNGDLFVAGWQNGDLASSPANVALDKVELLALLAALYGVEHTVEIARRVWTDETIVDLIPFVQKAAVPAATRQLPGWDKHLLETLRGEMSKLVPEEEADNIEQVTLSRFSIRGFVMIALLIVAVVVVLTQMKPDEMIRAVKAANFWFALVCLAFSFLAWVGSAITLGGFMDRDKRNYAGLICSQMAQGFAAVSMPAGIGPAFVNLQFLRKSGYKNTVATAIMSAVWAVQAATTVVLLVIIGIFTGRNALSGMIPTNTLIIVVAVVAVVVSLAMLIPPIRKIVLSKLLPLVTSYARALLETLTQPRELIVGILGGVVLNIATGLGFWAALLAFGYQTNPIETTFVFLLANTLGSAVPTPGGLGAVEAALSVAFTAVGVPSTIAVSATLVYRVAFYWIRIPVGALASKWLDRHNLI